MGDHHHEAAHDHAPELSALERRLYKRPTGIHNECSDLNIAYDSCVREHAGNPLSFIVAVWWADRYLCAHEKHAFSHCETGRAEAAFKRNFDLIKANRKGEIS